MMKSYKIQYFLTSIWFATMSFICFAYGTGDNYKAAPFFIFISIVILCIYGRRLNNVTRSFKYLALLYVVSSVGLLINTSFSINAYSQFLSYSLTGCITVITSYCLVKSNPKLLKLFAYMLLVFFVVGISRFFREQSLLNSFYAITSFYFLLFPLPLILLGFNKKTFHIALLLITIVFCVLSLKRSAAISSVFLLLMYLLIVAKSGVKQLLYVAVLLIVIGVFVSSYFQDSNFLEYVSRLFTRLENLEEDKGSGRGDVIEAFFMHDISDLFSFPDFFIGRGYEAYHRKYQTLAAAHNDFIEIIFSTGILGLYCLCRFFSLIFRRSIYLLKNNSNIAMSYVSIAFLFFFYAFASSNFHFYNLSLPLFLSIGVLEGYMFSNNRLDS